MSPIWAEDGFCQAIEKFEAEPGDRRRYYAITEEGLAQQTCD